jgi:hypothetical protein
VTAGASGPEGAVTEGAGVASLGAVAASEPGAGGSASAGGCAAGAGAGVCSVVAGGEGACATLTRSAMTNTPTMNAADRPRNAMLRASMMRPI